MNERQWDSEGEGAAGATYAILIPKYAFSCFSLTRTLAGPRVCGLAAIDLRIPVFKTYHLMKIIDHEQMGFSTN